MPIKPLRTSKQIVLMMKNDKGIKFDICTEQEAEKYLLYKNNYMRTACYRNNYFKATKGQNSGKYINLDFAYLQEFSRIDFKLRNLVTSLCLDIEHYLKVSLLRDIENDPNEDGYNLVSNFLTINPYIVKNITRNSRSAYIKELVSKYFNNNSNNNDCPIWVLLELISFGDFLKLYDTYYLNSNVNYIDKKILNSVISLRNACAHNNCILQNLKSGTAKPQPKISNIVSKINNISKYQMKKKLESRPILELTVLFYLHSKIVSKKTKEERYLEIKDLFYNRVYEKADYFTNNELITSSLKFMHKIIDAFYK